MSTATGVRYNRVNDPSVLRGELTFDGHKGQRVPSKGASEAQSEQARALTAKKGIKTNLEVREKKEEKWGE